LREAIELPGGHARPSIVFTTVSKITPAPPPAARIWSFSIDILAEIDHAPAVSPGAEPVNGGKAIRYGIGVGRPGFAWSGVKEVSMKREWPDWTPPDEMLRRRPDLPRYMPGGPENPLGARALYLGSSLYRIHGSNEPWTIGT